MGGCPVDRTISTILVRHYGINQSIEVLAILNGDSVFSARWIPQSRLKASAQKELDRYLTRCYLFSPIWKYILNVAEVIADLLSMTCRNIICTKRSLRSFLPPVRFIPRSTSDRSVQDVKAASERKWWCVVANAFQSITRSVGRDRLCGTPRNWLAGIAWCIQMTPIIRWFPPISRFGSRLDSLPNSRWTNSCCCRMERSWWNARSERMNSS